MKTLLCLLSLTFSMNSFAYTQCVNWDEDRNQCAQEVRLADEESVTYLSKEVEKQGQVFAQSEKRLKGEMIKLVAEARRQMVLDFLNDPEMRELIKEKIKNL